MVAELNTILKDLSERFGYDEKDVLDYYTIITKLRFEKDIDPLEFLEEFLAWKREKEGSEE